MKVRKTEDDFLRECEEDNKHYKKCSNCGIVYYSSTDSDGQHKIIMLGVLPIIKPLCSYCFKKLNKK